MKNPVRRSTQWGIQVILAVVFISAGLAKLSGVESMERLFGSIGIGQWFRYFVGAVELVSGLLLFSSVYSVIGATLILMTMAGAVFVHLFLIGGNAMPAFLLGALSAILLILKRSEVTSAGREAPGIP